MKEESKKRKEKQTEKVNKYTRKVNKWIRKEKTSEEGKYKKEVNKKSN